MPNSTSGSATITASTSTSTSIANGTTTSPTSITNTATTTPDLAAKIELAPASNHQTRAYLPDTTGGAWQCATVRSLEYERQSNVSEKRAQQTTPTNPLAAVSNERGKQPCPGFVKASTLKRASYTTHKTNDANQNFHAISPPETTPSHDGSEFQNKAVNGAPVRPTTNLPTVNAELVSTPRNQVHSAQRHQQGEPDSRPKSISKRPFLSFRKKPELISKRHSM